MEQHPADEAGAAARQVVGVLGRRAGLGAAADRGRAVPAAQGVAGAGAEEDADGLHDVPQAGPARGEQGRDAARGDRVRVRRRASRAREQPVRPADDGEQRAAARRPHAPAACRPAGRATGAACSTVRRTSGEREPQQRQVREQHVDRVLPVEAVRCGRRRRAPRRRRCAARLGVVDDGVGDARPPGGRRGWPASPGRRRRGSSGSAGSRPPSASQTSRRTSMPGRADREHGAGAVVLALVLLAALQAGLAPAAAGDGDADLEQQPPVDRGRAPWGRRRRPAGRGRPRRAGARARRAPARSRRAAARPVG